MPKFNVQRSVEINKPIAEVFSSLNNYDHWTPWSPWLVTEKEAKVKVSDDKKFYEWEGNVVGSGQMQITSEVENKEIHIDLAFLKPWKSQAKTSFYLSESNGGTNVTWTMDGSLPFFMFWMKKMMTEIIGMDYDRGLMMLKEYIEHGKVSSDIKILGEHQFPSSEYVGVKRKCTMAEISTFMQKDYEMLMPYMMENYKDSITGNAFSIYHKWDLPNKEVEYTACVPVKGDVKLKDGMIRGSHPGGKMFSCEHTGPYKYVGNAWSAMEGRSNAKVFRKNKKIHPIEEYLNSPKDTAENELKSVIRFGVK